MDVNQSLFYRNVYEPVMYFSFADFPNATLHMKMLIEYLAWLKNGNFKKQKQCSLRPVPFHYTVRAPYMHLSQALTLGIP